MDPDLTWCFVVMAHDADSTTIWPCRVLSDCLTACAWRDVVFQINFLPQWLLLTTTNSKVISVAFLAQTIVLAGSPIYSVVYYVKMVYPLPV